MCNKAVGEPFGGEGVNGKGWMIEERERDTRWWWWCTVQPSKAESFFYEARAQLRAKRRRFRRGQYRCYPRTFFQIPFESLSLSLFRDRSLSHSLLLAVQLEQVARALFARGAVRQIGDRYLFSSSRRILGNLARYLHVPFAAPFLMNRNELLRRLMDFIARRKSSSRGKVGLETDLRKCRLRYRKNQPAPLPLLRPS